MTRSIVRSVVRGVVRGAVRGPSSPAEPDEFVTNGGFADATFWVIGNGGWDISGGVATNLFVSTGTNLYLGQLFGTEGVATPLIAGNSYVFEVNVVNPDTCRLRVRMFPITQTIYDQEPADGLLSIPFVASEAHSSFRIYDFDFAGIILDNVSLRPA